MTDTGGISIRDLGFGRSTFRLGCSRGLFFVVVLVCGYMVYHEDLQVTMQYQDLSMATTSEISQDTTSISWKKQPMHAHQAPKTVPEVLVLITPAGGLTHIKQRLSVHYAHHVKNILTRTSNSHFHGFQSPLLLVHLFHSTPFSI